MAGIPLHITPLSYIRGSGSQYITTDFHLRSTDVVKSKWRFEGASGNVYGCYTSGSAADNFCLYAGSASSNAYIRYNGQVVRGFKAANGTIYNLEHGPDGFFANGDLVTSFNDATFECSAPMYIFMLPNSSSAKVTARCYGLTVYRGGEQACNFIPARNELTGKVGFYESVGGVFYENAGTGVFTAGPEVNFSVKTLLLKRRRALASLSLLPPYTSRIEYLESSRTQYINTGLLPDPMTFGYQYGITALVASAPYTFGGVFLNWDTNSPNVCITGSYTNKQFGFPTNWRAGSGTPQIGPLSSVGAYTEVSLVNNNDWDGSSFTLSLTSPLVSGQQTFSNPYRSMVPQPFYLFAGNQNGVAKEFAKMRLYYIKFLRYNEVIMDLVPVRVGQVGYLYDRISGKLLGNAGSGDFILGPDI